MPNSFDFTNDFYGDVPCPSQVTEVDGSVVTVNPEGIPCTCDLEHGSDFAAVAHEEVDEFNTVADVIIPFGGELPVVDPVVEKDSLADICHGLTVSGPSNPPTENGSEPGGDEEENDLLPETTEDPAD